MNKKGVILSLLSCIILTVAARLELVVEMCRHGSRVPQRDTFGTKYSNGKGMLTPSGLRQHYLLGVEMRRRYMKGYPNVHQLIDPSFETGEVFARSTQTRKTVQSASAQLLGLYPLGIGEDLPPHLADVALPLVKIPNVDQIIEDLGPDAIKKGKQPVSVRNFGSEHDRFLGFGGCPYMSNDFIRRSNDTEVWQYNDDKFRPLIFNQIAQAFGRNPDDLHFMTILDYLEALYTEEFEGIQNRFEFSDGEWEIVRSMQVAYLLNILNPLSSEILALRHIDPIRELMRAKMGRDFNETLAGEFGDAKFVLLSSHAYQMAHIIHRMEPENLELNHIDFASVLLFELHRVDSRGCETSTSESCFFIRVFFNDLQLKLPGCRDIDCTFRDFSRHIDGFDINEEKMHQICYSEKPLEGVNLDQF
ncbi:unnamed protein product [Moneuplotes crassus]|uniref:Acid phosphatase n=1 Tax=Euplotes crassus TaxID=5936 RepID=A0AAD1XFY5_EUPCR|nr:unnamed protein product [Moneuplotes crassus]